jgi:hypothetical protein
MTDKITLAVVHGASQFIVATFVGKVLDGIIPYNPSKENIGQLTLEITLQVCGDVIATAGLMDFLNNSLDMDQYDPANGFAYILGLLDSQPNLRAKIAKFNSIMGAKLGDFSFLNGSNRVPGTARVPVPTENQFISGNAAYN